MGYRYFGPRSDFIADKAQTHEETTANILKDTFLGRVWANKPCVVLVVAKSGEGKSWTTLKICEYLAKAIGVDATKHLDDFLVFTPMEYATKLKRILFESKDKEIKRICFLVCDEASVVVNAHTWNSFINNTITLVNAVSRGVKPMAFFFIIQSIKRIDVNVRETADFMVSTDRPRGQRVGVKIERIWTNNYDLQNIKLGHAPIWGYLREKVGNKTIRKAVKPQFEFYRPKKELTEIYEKIQKERKGSIALKKLEEMENMIVNEVSGKTDRIQELARYHAKTPESYAMITSLNKKGEPKLLPEVKKMYNLTSEEFKLFDKYLAAEHQLVKYRNKPEEKEEDTSWLSFKPTNSEI